MKEGHSQVGFNPEEHNEGELAETTSSYAQDAAESASETSIVNTNNMSPDLDDGGFRRVALNRAVGFDHPHFANEDLGIRDAKDVFAYFEDRLASNEMESGSEIEKNAEQKEICEFIIDEVPEFLREYGLETPVRIPETSIRILNMDSLEGEERARAKKFPGQWYGLTQKIDLNGDYVADNTNLKFAKVLIHELIHVQSFGSVVTRFNEAETMFSIEQRRGGLVSYTETRDKDGNPTLDDNFAYLDEAVTELLARRFLKEYINKIPHISEGVEKVKGEMQALYDKQKSENPKMMLRAVDIDTGIEYGDENPQYFLKKESPSYSTYVNMLVATLKKIKRTYDDLPIEDPRKNRHGFPDDESVLKLVTKAYFTGHQLEFARLLKTVYPDMSYRYIGHNTRIKGAKRDQISQQTQKTSENNEK